MESSITMFQIFIITIIVLVSLANSAETIETVLCMTHENQTGACDCINHSSSPWGTRSIQIDCQLKGFTIITFNYEVLPIFTEKLDLSWNKFEYVPDFDSESLKFLIMSQNNITALDDNNFIKVPNLRHLDLSWNSIEVISVNAFSGLNHLQVLDLSHNHLRKISFHVFSYLVSLEELNLSWNVNLNETFAVKEVDLFIGLGVSPSLKSLKMDYCGLNSLDISQGTNLTNVFLEWNNFTSTPLLPPTVTYLDMSGNPIEVMGFHFLSGRLSIETLMMEDMPKLREIGPYALYHLPSLKKISFQNSKLLTTISPEIFGSPLVRHDVETFQMDELVLSGTGLETINSNLSTIFEKIKSIDLVGLPLDCDCRIIWVKHLNIETGARCHEPKILHGKKVSEMNFNESECKHWPGWIQHTMHGLMLVVFLVMCSVGLYVLIVRLRPFQRSSMRKVGPSSPYAPITIEPNRAENHF